MARTNDNKVYNLTIEEDPEPVHLAALREALNSMGSATYKVEDILHYIQACA
jgi:hypothetical protein